MESKSARELLEKYWNCETSLEEEEMLRKYFLQNEIPSDLRKYQDMFRYYSAEREKELEAGFDEKIIGRLRKEKNPEKQRYMGHFYKAAAAVLLILSVYVINDRFIVVREHAKQVVEDTFKDPEKALEETKKVLFFVSEKLNKGKEEATKLNKFKKAEDVVRNSNYKEI